MKIDLFNNNRIEFLEDEVEKLWCMLAKKERDIKELQEKPLCFKEGDSVSDDYIVGAIYYRLKAIEKYLNIIIEQEWVKDPSRLVKQEPKILVYKARKIRKNI